MADWLSQDANLRTPLDAAGYYDNLDLAIKLITEHGADVKQPNEEDRDTALMVACGKMFTDQLPLVKTLLEYGAEIHRSSGSGLDVRMWADKGGNDDAIAMIRSQGGYPPASDSCPMRFDS